MIECVPPDQLAVLADGAVLIANMTGFRAASFSYKETSTNVTIRLPEVQVPTVRVYVHPPEQDYIISRGLLTKGGWWYPTMKGRGAALWGPCYSFSRKRRLARASLTSEATLAPSRFHCLLLGTPA